MDGLRRFVSVFELHPANNPLVKSVKRIDKPDGVTLDVETSAGRFSVMARTVGLEEESSDGFLRWLADLKAEIGVPAIQALDSAGMTKATSYINKANTHLSNALAAVTALTG